MKDEATELRQFLDRQRKLTDAAHERERNVFLEHQPYVHRVTSVDKAPYTDGLIVLRCRTCRTAEHHTYGPLNDALWPCPTILSMLDLKAYGEIFGVARIPVEEES
ncbi:hypothetical protein [Gordonia tangerina]|uniref:Uncharacterized protein n=1 Tax=Gordonia tangerina TaxID=2911060 RepID=A0ABS9DL35_9ACTN|nr:hypothetical protein [Gordonia tangerina]MCF3939949.1 hypothetical protein [Gordonia tangerina]